VDLGGPVVIERLVLVLEAVDREARLRVHTFTVPARGGGPPVASEVLAADLSALPTDARGRRVVVLETLVVARFVWLALEADVPVVLALSSARVEGTTPFGSTLAETYARSFSLFADRPLFLAREAPGAGPFVVTHTFREVWALAVSIARGLRSRLSVGPDERVFVAVVAKNRPEWLAVEAACILQGFAFVPLAPDEPGPRLEAILRACPAHVVVCEEERAAEVSGFVVEGRTSPLVVPVGALAALGEGCARGPLPAAYDEEALFTVLFTSGSTGTPKGAMRSYRKTHTMLVTYGVPQPARHLSFQPLSHLSERHYMPAVVVNGGAVAFGGGGAHLLSDLAALEPSWVSSVPRLFDVVRAGFERDVVARSAEHEEARAVAEALAAARLVFGRRLQGVSTGSAPVSPATLAFMERCFGDVWVFDGYGSTEVGTIAASGRVPPDVEVRLAEVPGQPAGRGEILVRSPHMIDGYLGDAEATRRSLDGDGFFRTGDLGERTEDGGVRVVGRLVSAVKLGQGELVSVDGVEAELAACPIVDRIFVHPAPSSVSLLAVVVPRREVLAEALGAPSLSLEDACAHADAPRTVVAALREYGRARGLRPHELPTGAVLEPAPFTVASKLLTASGKLARREAIARYGSRLAALDVAEEAPTALRGAGLGDLVAVASAVARRPVSADERLADGVGQDSLAVAELLAALEVARGAKVPLATWFRARTLRELASLLEGREGQSERAEGETGLVLRDLAWELPRAFTPSEDVAPAHVLLTGVTGLLGVHLLEELLATTRAHVTCLVRGRGSPPEERVERTLSRYGVPAVDRARVTVVEADLGSPGLGLGAAERARLEAEVDTIVHAGAHVTWLHLYEGVRDTNVGGTAELLALAARGRPKRLAFVSTISAAPATGDEDTTLPLEHALLGSGYVLSKWIAEALVVRARAAGLSATVHRPGLITGHSARGKGNPDDFVHRYLAACVRYGVALGGPERLDMTPVDYVARAIVASLVAPSPETLHLCNVRGALSYAAIGEALAATGAPCELVRYEEFRRRAVLPAGGPLRPLVAYFPEETFTIESGPWPSSRTETWLGARGIVCPKADAGTIARMLAGLRACP